MVRLYISADIEGVCGVTHPRQCAWQSPDRTSYDQAVSWMMAEVNAVVQGALDGGAEAVVVNDAHATMTNLVAEALIQDSRVSLLSGKPKLCAMTAHLNSQVDGLVMVGYHAMAGTENGVLAHTFHDHIQWVSLNGVRYGEGGINALYAQLAYGIPTILAGGDNLFCAEIRQTLPKVHTITTKTGLGFQCAQHRSQDTVRQEYQQAIQDLVAQRKASPKAWDMYLVPSTKTPQAPFVLDLCFQHPLDADIASTMPGTQRLDGQTLRWESPSMALAYQGLQAMYSLLAYAKTL